MYKDLINERITIIVSSRGDNLLEYVGVLSNENDDTLELKNVDISYMMLNFQKGLFGGNIYKYAENVDRVIINKHYIISCHR